MAVVVVVVLVNRVVNVVDSRGPHVVHGVELMVVVVVDSKECYIVAVVVIVSGHQVMQGLIMRAPT